MLIAFSSLAPLTRERRNRRLRVHQRVHALFRGLFGGKKVQEQSTPDDALAEASPVILRRADDTGEVAILRASVLGAFVTLGVASDTYSH